VNKNILIVDDFKLNRIILSKMLEGNNVFCAESAKMMRDILKKEKIDLILLDIMMPEESGIEATRKLKEDKENKNIPIIFVTASSAVNDFKIGLEIADDYVEKPVKKEVLLSRIKKVLKEYEEKEELIQKIAFDFLTEVHTRRFFEKRAEEIISHYSRNKNSISFVLLDIDKFKNINDIYGHLAGDYILKVFSKLLKEVVREYDIVSRYGGDEFFIIFVECDKKTALKILNRIEVKIEQTEYIFEGNKIHFTFSAGLVMLSEIEVEKTVKGIVEVADKRLYKAKKEGRSRIVGK